MFVTAIILLNLISAAVIAIYGKKEELWVVVFLLACVFLPPLISEIQIGTFRIGVFLLEMAFLLSIMNAIFKVNLWWPILTAGAQLLAFVSHLVPMLVSDVYIWSSVSVRLGIWTFVSLFLIFGAWETWAHKAIKLRELANGRSSELR